jgi:hypothetical protein
MPKNKPFLNRQGRKYMERPVETIPIKQIFLIVCEGEKTEPYYFEKFRVPGLVVQVEGLGMITLSLVQRAIELRTQDEYEYDQTWCVFDKDDNSDNDFNQAIALAERCGIRVAYSNQCFELWYVLHFCFMQNSITRSAYMKILDRELGHKYIKNRPEIYDELRHLQTEAIRNARKLMDQYSQNNPARDDPSTTVHHLVEQLVEFSKPFGTR